MNSRHWKPARAASLAALALGLTAPAFAQTILGTNGLPYDIDPGVDAASWHLNTNSNGVQDFGEWAVDVGGTADTGVSFDPALLSVQINSIDIHPYHSFNLGITVDLTVERGVINGFMDYVLILPDSSATHDMPYVNIGSVDMEPTRGGGNIHTVRNGLPVQFFTDFNVLGGISGLTGGQVHGQPLVHVVQEGVILAEYMKTRGVTTQIVRGGSFGAAAAVLSVLLRPDVYHGGQASGTPIGLRSFQEWHQVFATLAYVRGGNPLFSFGNPGGDLLQTITGQVDLTEDTFDALRNPGFLRRPFQFANGSVDPHVFLNNHADEFLATAAAQGAGHVELDSRPNGGHGEPFNPAYVPSIQTFDDFIQDVLANQNTLLGTAAMPMPICYEDQYASLLNQFQRTLGVSVGNPNLLTPHFEFGGLGSNLGGFFDSFALVTLPGGSAGTLFATNHEGMLRRYDYDPVAARFAETWELALGLGGKAVVVSQMQAGGPLQVVVGDQRGYTVVDVNGNVVRQNSTVRDAHSFAVGPILNSNSLQMAYISDGTLLNIENAATGALLHRSRVGQTGKLIIGENNANGNANLYLADARGHVVRLRVDEPPAGVSVTAEMISDYAECQLRSLALVNTTQGARLVASGQRFKDDLPFVRVMDINGQTQLSVAVPGALGIEHIYDVGNDEVIAGGPGFVGRINVVSGTVTPFDLSGSTGLGGHSIAVGNVSGAGGQEIAVLSTRRIRALDANQVILGDLEGSDLTWASDVHLNDGGPTDRFELSIVARNRDVITYDLATGLELAGTRFQLAEISSAHRLPRTIVRTGDALDNDNLQYFDQAGVWANGIARFTSSCGWLLATSSREAEHNHLVDNLPETQFGFGGGFAQRCEKDLSGTPAKVLTGVGEFAFTAALSNSRVLGSLQEFTISILDLSGKGKETHYAVSTPDGDVMLYANAANQFPVAQASGFGRGIVSIASLGPLGERVIAIASMFPDANGDTLYLCDSDLSVIASTNAGMLSGMTVGDMTGDGSDDVIAGGLNGTLAVHGQALNLIYSRNDGHLALGDRESMKFVPATPSAGLPEPLLVYSHSSGYQVWRVTP